MTHRAAASAIEAYLLVTSDNRRFIVQTADPEAAKRNFPVPGESIRIVSMQPVIKDEKWLTVQELADALAVTCSKAPHWQTLRAWALEGKIPHKTVGKKFMRFVEADVRASMAKPERA